MTMQTPENKQWVAVVPVPQSQRAPAPDRKYIGDGHDILLQGFHWASHAGARDHGSRAKKSWYRVLKDNAAAIKAAGFTWVWFPPPSDSLSPQGYIPRRWNVLNTPYGSEHETPRGHRGPRAGQGPGGRGAEPSRRRRHRRSRFRRPALPRQPLGHCPGR